MHKFSIKQFLNTVIFCVLLYGVGHVFWQRDENHKRASSVCNAVKIGYSEKMVRDFGTSADYMIPIGKDEVWRIGFIFGKLPMTRFICTVDFKEGKVTKTSFHED